MDSARARKKEQIGSFAGLQQTMKGAAQVMGSFWGSFYASQNWSAYAPLYLSSLVATANAVIIYDICCSPNSRGARQRHSFEEFYMDDSPSSGSPRSALGTSSSSSDDLSKKNR
jgi:hypothetical protein